MISLQCFSYYSDILLVPLRIEEKPLTKVKQLPNLDFSTSDEFNLLKFVILSPEKGNEARLLLKHL